MTTHEKWRNKPEFSKYNWKEITERGETFVVAYRFMERNEIPYTFQSWFANNPSDNYFWIGIFEGNLIPDNTVRPTIVCWGEPKTLEQAMDQANEWWTAGNA